VRTSTWVTSTVVGVLVLGAGGYAVADAYDLVFIDADLLEYPEYLEEALRIVSQASGFGGMIGGQVVDMKGAQSYDELISLYRMKTGALMAAAAKIGVLASGKRDPEYYKAVTAYTDNIGIAFQIKDYRNFFFYPATVVFCFA